MAEECTQETNDCDCNCLINQIKALEARDEALLARIEAVERKTDANDTYLAGMFGFVGNTGVANSTQSTIANVFDGLDLDAHFFSGNNNRPAGLAATIDANWINFDSQLTELYPAMGVWDWYNGGALDGQAQIDKFTELPSPGRYYSVLFNNGGVELFCVNSNDTDPHGWEEGSTQWKWLIDAISASAARWKVVMFNKSFLGINDAWVDADYPEEMDWHFERLGVHLLINGTDLANWHIRKNGLDIVNVAVGSELTPATIVSGVLTDPTKIKGDALATAGAYCVYADYSGTGDTGVPMIGTIEADWQELRVKFRDVSDGSVIHEFTV